MTGPARPAVLSSALAPVLLVGGWTLAAARQPASYRPARDTISALAAHGATDRWLMTGALVGLGACHLVTAAGLRPAGLPGRALLALGGLATLGVAVFPQDAAGRSTAHGAVAALAFAALGAWPLGAARQGSGGGLLRRPVQGAAAAVLLALPAGFALDSGGAHAGLVERLAAGAQALWPLAVVLAARGRRPA